MEQDKAFDVFISYRRNGGAVYADFLYEKLSHLDYRVFQDKQELGSGFYDENLILAISRCTDVVVVLSSHALDRCQTDSNDWVRVEIRTALEKGKNLVPFISSHFEWPENLPEDIARFPFCNGPVFADNKLSDCVEHELPDYLKSSPLFSAENGKHMLISHYEPPKGVFCGRENVLRDLRRHFESGGNTVVLFGLGGIGKSEVAKAYAKRFRSCYKTIVFARFRESIVQTFIDDAVFNITGVFRLLNETVRMESREKYFARKLASFKEIAGPETLIIIDDFPGNPESLDSSLFDFLSGGCHVILTTRNNLSEYFPSIELTPEVCKEDALAVFSTYYGRKPGAADAESIGTLLEFVKYHTLAIELIAKHMKVSRLNPKRMLEALRKKGLLSLTGRVSAPHADMSPKAANEFIYSLYSLSEMTDEDRTILCSMAVMPHSGVNADDFMKWADVGDYVPISGLVDTSWLTFDPESDKLSMHPLIRELVLARLKPDPDRCKAVMRTAERFWKEVQNPIAARQWTDVIPILELVRGWQVHLLEESAPFRRQVCNALAEAYYQMACYSEAYVYYEELCHPFVDENGTITASDKEMPMFRRMIKSLSNGYNRFNESYRIAKSLLSRATELYGDDTDEQMKYLEVLAFCAADLNQIEESYRLRKKTADFCVDNPSVPLGEQIRILSALTNPLSYLGRHQESYAHRIRVCKMLESLDGDNAETIGLAKSNLALSALGTGKREEALSLIEEARRLSEKNRGPDDFYTLCIKTNCAMIMSANGIPDALAANRNTYERQKEIWGDTMDVTMKTKCNYAMTCHLVGMRDESAKLLSELEQTKASMETFPPRLESVLTQLRELVDSNPRDVDASSLNWQSVTFLIPAVSN